MQRIYPVAQVLESPTCPSLPFHVIMSTQEVREEALLNIRCIVRGYHLCRFEVSAGDVFTANKKRRERGNAFKVLTIVDSSAAYSPSLWIPFGQYLQIFLCQSATNRYQFIYRLLLKIDTNR